MPGGSMICIVDDDESVRETLEGLLRSMGHDVRSFISAEEFLADASLPSVGCVILDATMPGMSGMDLQDRLLIEERRIPIIIMTARTEEELHARLVERGAVACLLKPFSEDALLAAVRAATSPGG